MLPDLIIVTNRLLALLCIDNPARAAELARNHTERLTIARTIMQKRAAYLLTIGMASDWLIEVA